MCCTTATTLPASVLTISTQARPPTTCATAWCAVVTVISGVASSRRPREHADCDDRPPASHGERGVTVFLADPDVTLYVGDALAVLAELPDESVHCCVTSPPYWGLRDYGVAGQLGLEATPQEYVERMVEVFCLARELLADDGTLWLNLGDSYAGSWGNYGGQNRTVGKQRAISAGSRVPNPAWDERTKFKPAAATPPDGLKNKDLVGIPWRVAFALQADGWYLRSEIIWHKVAPMPESVRDRPTRSHEQVFLLAKSERYFYNTEAARDPLKDNSIARLTQLNYEEQEGSERGNGGAKTNGKMKAVAAHFGGRNKSQINDQTRLASGNEWNQDPTAGANWR